MGRGTVLLYIWLPFDLIFQEFVPSSGHRFGHWVFGGLTIAYLAALAGLCSQLSARLTLFPDRVELRRRFKTQIFRFADIDGPFVLSQRRFMPGFDILFQRRDHSVAERVGVLDAIEDELCDLLNFYKDRAAS
jgi:hypothetical protein